MLLNKKYHHFIMLSGIFEAHKFSHYSIIKSVFHILGPLIVDVDENLWIFCIIMLVMHFSTVLHLIATEAYLTYSIVIKQEK